MVLLAAARFAPETIVQLLKFKPQRPKPFTIVQVLPNFKPQLPKSFNMSAGPENSNLDSGGGGQINSIGKSKAGSATQEQRKLTSKATQKSRSTRIQPTIVLEIN
ncbi:hypothetical protein L6164_018322 [Bauhinia variegata]|uniref:Uncharacterized protein n=1 Tax=Bauhinia variegata TaxID=167791 RepID=A0ACB9NFN7_BAUVA|nr:hypothetical protein L6164_018322 [Bauhinia variegata]